MSFETILVECARENSINFKFDPTNSLSKNNSKWTNNVNFQVKIGDQISVENCVIHSIGNSGEGTIEINGTQNENNFVDNQQGFQFMYYVNNNGYNAVQLPYVGGYNNRNSMVISDNIQLIFNNNLDNSQFVGMTVFVDNPTVDGVIELNPKFNAPILTNDFNFVFDHKNFLDEDGAKSEGDCQICTEDNMFTLYKQIPNKLNSSGDKTYDACKYILLNKDFKGYYRASNDGLSGDGDFDDDADDLVPYTQDVSFKIDVGFTTPSTICNDITEALHSTFEDPENEIDVIDPDGNPVVGGVYQGKCYPIVKCNGIHNEYQSPCWSNIAVKDFEKARGVYNMMRTSIAFDGKFRFDESIDEYLINRPAIHISGCVCKFKAYNGDIIETSMYPYKKIDYTIKGTAIIAQTEDDPGSTADFDNKASMAIFTLIPKGWLVTTNMKYTEKNVERMIRYFEGNEKYTGNFTDETEQNSDIENWYIRMDLGASRDGANTTETRPTTAGQLSYSGKISTMRNLANGKIRIDDSPLSDFDVGGIYAGGLPANPYSINTKLNGMTIGSDGTDYRMLTCPRSQTIRRGTKMYSSEGFIEVESTTGLDGHFYNNKFGDCNLTLYSRFRDDYKTFIKQKNTDLPQSDWKEGDGEIKYPIDVDQIDTSLTTKYGIYGAPVTKYNIGHNEYILCLDGKPLYLQAFGDEIVYINNEKTKDENDAQYYRFLSKIQVATAGSNQETYGGYEYLQWNDDIATEAFEKNNDVYIYTGENHNLHPDHDLDSVTYRDGKKIDFEKFDNQVVFYVQSTYIWVGEIVDDIKPFTGINLYPIDGMSFPISGTEQNKLFYFYFVLNAAGTLTVTSVKGTNLYVVTNPEGASSAPALTPLLEEKSDGADIPDNTYPYLATANAELCISFILQNDSYTVDNSGDKQINECKHILPSMYQSLFLCSPAFLDLPTIWMLNSMSNFPTTGYLTDGAAQQYMSVGASDPTCAFDTSLQKATFSQFHTSRILGITEMPTTDGDENTLDTDTLGSVVTKYYGKDYPYYNILDFITVDAKDEGFGQTKCTLEYGTNTNCLNHPQYATSGIMINKLYGTSTDINNNLQEIASEDDFNNTLLFKLGFLYENFFNNFGQQDKLYDSSIVGKYDKANRYRNTKYYTTNPIIDISVEPFLSVYNGGGLSEMEGLPRYQLSYLPEDMPHTIDGGTSEQIVASNKPIKQTSSYYQIRSDLISTNYIANNERVNTIALGMKEYTSNDFIYCNTNDYGLTALQEQNISTITTELRLSTGNLAPSNQLNTVIYKIRRPIILEDLQTIVENSQQLEKQYLKEVKQEQKQK